jgi:hypothetical protein
MDNLKLLLGEQALNRLEKNDRRRIARRNKAEFIPSGSPSYDAARGVWHAPTVAGGTVPTRAITSGTKLSIAVYQLGTIDGAIDAKPI